MNVSYGNRHNNYNQGNNYRRPFNYKKKRRIFIKDKFAEQYPYNEYIKFKEVRVIDENGKNLGIMSRLDALNYARSKSLDLVVISPNANVPVAKVIDLNSFKYQLQKKEKLAKKGQKKNKIKEIKLSPLIAEGDLQRKLDQIQKFLNKGYPVKVTIMKKRRITKEMFNDFVKKILTLLESCCNILNTQNKGRDTHILLKAGNAKNKNTKNID